jgi:hypothetical protein
MAMRCCCNAVFKNRPSGLVRRSLPLRVNVRFASKPTVSIRFIDSPNYFANKCRYELRQSFGSGRLEH